MSGKRCCFWFDLENAPNVPFFAPIAKRLQADGHEVHITARDYADIPSLARGLGLSCDVIGSHGGGAVYKKVTAGLSRCLRLALWTRGRRIDLAAGFGSRTLAMTCGLLRIKNVTAFDYEHVSVNMFARWCDMIYIPEAVPPEAITSRGVPPGKIGQFPGLKEEVYTAGYMPTEDLGAELGVDKDKALVVMRPPATLAHYHDHGSEAICRRILGDIGKRPDVQAIFVRRHGDATFDDHLKAENIRLLPRPVNGMDLINLADLVLSGGGTMIREAVAMDVPAYSFFTGRPGAVDEGLVREGRLLFIKSADDAARIEYVKRARHPEGKPRSTATLDFFVREFLRLARM